MNTEEIFKDIPGYEGIYKVSNLGRIKSVERINIRNVLIRECFRKFRKSTTGYLRVNLSYNGVIKTELVHQLVAMAFLTYSSNDINMVCDHINNIRTDNRLENLQVISQRKNASKDRYRQNYSSKYVGVTWHKATKKWQSTIYADGKYKYLGVHTNEHDAHLEYQKELKKLK